MTTILDDPDSVYYTGREEALTFAHIGREILNTHRQKRIDERTIILIKVYGSTDSNNGKNR
ncbi:hypothetical protein [Petrimonas sulfuriphila]|uniref:hypothetical protein n=1 Tax=Petrimonas sulfuriphila TaxID=285070 RepID=UPI003EB71C73